MKHTTDGHPINRRLIFNGEKERWSTDQLINELVCNHMHEPVYEEILQHCGVFLRDCIEEAKSSSTDHPI